MRALLASGRDVVVLDDLSTGLDGFVPEGVPVVRGSIDDPVAVAAALDGGDPGRRGRARGGLQVRRGVGVQAARDLPPQRGRHRRLLEMMAAAGVPRLVFSGSAAVFGTPPTELVDEATPHAPESPYGASKDMDERIIADTVAASDELPR